MALPATGINGAGTAVDDGITFINATYLGTPVTATVLTLTAAGVPHPFAKDANGNPLIILPPPGFQAGDQMVVLQLPFGSFTADQPPLDMQIIAAVSNLADVHVPLPIWARGGFRFGNDALDNPTTDPSIAGSAVTTTVIPSIFRLRKTYDGPEDETASGPNFRETYRIDLDVATGQTVTDVDLTDVLPNNLQFVAVTSTSAPATDISTPSTTTPGGTLARRFASVTGGPGASNARVTFSFYAPLEDLNGTAVIDPVTGDDVTAIDDASASATWTPIDTRDPVVTITSDATNNDHTLTIKSTATQKTNSIVIDTGAPGPTPGDTIKYTIDFQISDYFAFQNFVVSDRFSDGQNLDPAFAPTLEVTDGHGVGGATTGTFAAANFTFTPNVVGGADDLIFRVSDELVTRGFTPGNVLAGGAISAGGTGGNPLQSAPPLPFGPTTGRIRFRTVIQDIYGATGGAVQHSDRLGNDVTTGGDLLSVADLTTPTGQSETDTSSSGVTITTGVFDKSIYSINGNTTVPANPGVSPGDLVTFRLRLTLSATSSGGVLISDYLPLPIFYATEVTTSTPTVTAASPVAGTATFGPTDTFFASRGIAPTLTTNAGANRIDFTFPPRERSAERQHSDRSPLHGHSQ